MEAVGKNSCFGSVFIAPAENVLLKKKNNIFSYNHVVVSKNYFSRLRKICCRLSESEIGQENPRSKMLTKSKNKMEEYNIAMKRMMRNPYEYHHDLGLGVQPQKPEDRNHLKQEENVAYILNLQQDKDAEYWEIDLQSIIKRCRELGIRRMRRPARDFDPDSLHNSLPRAISSLEWAILEGKGKVYVVHCTAGRGRAPAVAIAYMFWFCGMNLNTAYKTPISKRPCGPSKRAICGATYDLAKNDPWKEPFESLPEYAFEDIADWERNLIFGPSVGLEHFG